MCQVSYFKSAIVVWLVFVALLLHILRSFNFIWFLRGSTFFKTEQKKHQNVVVGFYSVVSFVDFEQVNATLYISKIKSGNGQGGHALVVSVLKLFPLKKIYVHMSKKKN